MTSNSWNENSSALRLVAVVTDVGGPVALHDILSDLPANFGAPIVVVQSNHDIVLESASAGLRHTIKLKIAQVRHAAKLHAGAVYFIESGKSFLSMADNDDIRIGLHSSDQSDNSAIKLLEDFARILGPAMTAVFLSGRSSAEAVKQLCSILESNGCPMLVLARGESVVEELGDCVLHASSSAAELSSVQIGEYLQQRAGQLLPERKSKIRADKR